jgi:hypothetical protein
MGRKLSVVVLLSLCLGIAAAVGTGTASAVVLCKQRTSPCPAASIYPSGTALSAQLSPKTFSYFTTSLGTVLCTGSTLAGKTTTASGNPLSAAITGLAFTGCTLNSLSCTVKVNGLPSTALVFAGTGGNGTLSSKFEATTSCGTTFLCSLESNNVGFSVTGGSPAYLGVNTALSTFWAPGTICPTSVTWHADYEVTAPNPLFVIANP